MFDRRMNKCACCIALADDDGLRQATGHGGRHKEIFKSRLLRAPAASSMRVSRVCGSTNQ